MRYLILFILGFMTLLFAGCSDENTNAVFGAHPDNWYNDHPGNIERNIESLIAECGGCHGLDLMGSGGAPSCFSTTFNVNSCHPGGPVPHPLDGSFGDAVNHGPVAKADLTVCQACHSDNPTGGAGSYPQFNVGIDSAGGIGCEACHAAGYAHPVTWAGPANDRYHYSAGNIQQACTLCHGGAALTSCADCHVEVVNFTLTCSSSNTSCHVMPPDGVNRIDHGTVADISDHDVCLTCHGMKESATGDTFSNVANYALFNKQTDIIGDHWDGNINMNSDTAYNEVTGGCDLACHGGSAPYTLPASTLNVVLGAYGAGEAPHLVGQDWLLPGGHVADAADFCVDCHTLTGGGQAPACQDCHIQGDPRVMPNCTSCHSAPPDTDSIDLAARPDRLGAHIVHDGFTTSIENCSACHQDWETDRLTHYDRVDQITPNYPADVALASSFDSNSLGIANYSTGGRTCSGVSCHGGLTTPDWLTGSIIVISQCTSCHTYGTSEDNSYNSGKHEKHVNDKGISCTECHNTETLQSGHFSNLETSAFEQDPSDTIGGGKTSIPSGYSGTCNFNCHDEENHENETW